MIEGQRLKFKDRVWLLAQKIDIADPAWDPSNLSLARIRYDNHRLNPRQLRQYLAYAIQHIDPLTVIKITIGRKD